MKDLTHLYEVNTLFEDVSRSLNNYLVDEENLLLGDTDAWYIGLYKPFKRAYFESDNLNINDKTILSLQYWDGTQYVDLPNLTDNTKNLSRSGFIEWSFDDNSKITDSWKEDSVNGSTMYWVRVMASNGTHGVLESDAGVSNTPTVVNIDDADIGNYAVNDFIYMDQENKYHKITNVDTTPAAANITITPGLTVNVSDAEPIYGLMDVKGMNIVYADDTDLKQEVRLIDDYRAQDDSSFIAYHVSARNDIVQTVRNGGDIKIVNTANPKYEQMNKWDFLDIGEINQAAKYLALAKIFFDSSENIDDKPYQRYGDYMGKYGEAFKLWFRTLDLDDDGETDDVETTNNGIINFFKV